MIHINITKFSSLTVQNRGLKTHSFNFICLTAHHHGLIPHRLIHSLPTIYVSYVHRYGDVTLDKKHDVKIPSVKPQVLVTLQDKLAHIKKVKERPDIFHANNVFITYWSKF